MSATGGPDDGGTRVPPRLVVLAGRKGRPSLLPFVAVLLVLATVGLVGLLLLNTALNRGAFTLKQRQAEATKLAQQTERAKQELAGLAEPGALASRASELGMVPGGNPAFLDPTAGTVLGSPSAAPTPAPPPTPSGSGTAGASGTPSVPATVSGSASGTASTPSGPATGTSATSGNAPVAHAGGQLPVTPLPSGSPTGGRG